MVSKPRFAEKAEFGSKITKIGAEATKADSKIGKVWLKKPGFVLKRAKEKKKNQRKTKPQE